ncbi:hypothetical protein [Nocardia concava]|uniref:hypothetical protein n=1 Tax=Nocardia concava TaxID=257281 RepID=UPI0009FE17C8|nr:hypothetical protein [Nocardia concava]
MSIEANEPTIPFATVDPALHLEYLYGPQWAGVMRIVERAAQLTAEERERMNAEAGKRMQDSMSALTGGGAGGLAGLLSGLGQQQSADPQPLQIASETAKEFGRSRNVQVAGLIAGQAVSATPSTGGDIAGLLQSLSSIGTLTVVSQAVTAAVLSDLVGRGRYTQEVHDALMQPWTAVIS